MASERRQFLNKINKRIYTLTKHGVDKQDVLNMIKPKLPDGAYITEFGQVNIDPTFWESNKSEIMETLDEQVKMYWDVKQDAMKPYENFIGPLPKDQADKELQAYIQYVKDFQEFVEYYYDMEKEFRDKGMSYMNDSEEMQTLHKLLSDEGSLRRADEIPYSQRMYNIERIRTAKGRIR